jgi:hypothetical protein
MNRHKNYTLLTMGFYKRTLRISRFKWRDRSKTPLYTQPAAHFAAQATEDALPIRSTLDVLHRAQVISPHIYADRAIVTICTAGYHCWLDDFLSSLARRGQVQNETICIFVLDRDAKSMAVIAHHAQRHFRGQLKAIHARSLAPIQNNIKSLIYSASRFITAKSYLCFEADMVILRSIQPLFHTLECSSSHLIHTTPGAGLPRWMNVYQWAEEHTHGTPEEINTMCGGQPHDIDKFHFGNGGIIAGQDRALVQLDRQLQKMQPRAQEWIDARPDVTWRDEFVFNLAVHELHAAAPLADHINTQLHDETTLRQLTTHGSGPSLHAYLGAQEITTLHFVGSAKQHQAHLRGHFAHQHADYRETLSTTN